MARTDVGISPWPVIKIIGILTPALASSCCKSRPLRPGNCTSSTRQPEPFGRSAAKNSCADENVCALNPAERMRFFRLSRVPVSSSTTNTNAFFSFIIKPPGRLTTSCRSIPRKNLRNLTIESRIYCFKQRFFFARLVQKSHRTGCERSRPRVAVCVRRDENDMNTRIDGSQLTLKIQSTHTWHAHIKKQAIRIVQFIRVQELVGRSETVRAHSN